MPEIPWGVLECSSPFFHLQPQVGKSLKSVTHDQCDARPTEFRRTCQREVPLFLEIHKFPYNTESDRWKEASEPKKPSSIRPVVSMQCRLVTDRRNTTTVYTALAQRRAVINKTRMPVIVTSPSAVEPLQSHKLLKSTEPQSPGTRTTVLPQSI